MLAHAFVRSALLAGSPIAIASGLVGYFAVLRGQVFAGDTLSHVAFAGALAAAAAGLDLRLGLFLATIAVALLLAAVGVRARSDDVAIGIVFAWVLGMGAFFLDRVNVGAGGADGTIAARTLFGSIFGLAAGDARLAAAVALAVALATVAIARPLLYATLDPRVALAQGLPVRALGAGFLVLVAIQVAEGTQTVGALLVLGLLAAPAGAAAKLTANPYRALALAPAIALAATWGGIALSFAIPSLPPSSAIIALACGCYAAATLLSARRR